MPHRLSVTGTHWHALARSRPLLISQLSQRERPWSFQAGSDQGWVEVLHGWPSTNATNSDSPTQAKMLRRASTAVLVVVRRRDGDGKSERDERTAGEACSGRARGLAGGLLARGVGDWSVPRTGQPRDNQPPWLAVSQRRTGFSCLKRRCWSEAEAGATWRLERQSSGCDDHVMSARQMIWRQLNNERRGRLVSTQSWVNHGLIMGQSWVNHGREFP